MVNPGTFKGLRKQFLDSQQDVYAAAIKGKHVADTVADIQRRYFKRFPITLSHTEEPSADSLAAVDDDAPDPEFGPPQLAALDSEAQTRAVRVYEFQLAELKMRKDVRSVLFYLSPIYIRVSTNLPQTANQAEASISI